MYSLPPLELAWRGWGELTNAFLGGMLLPAFGFSVQAARLDWRVFLLTLPFMLFVFVNLLATTWADRQADRAVGKFTLATRWPAGRLRRLYFFVVAAAYFTMFMLRDWLLPGSLVWLLVPLLLLTVWAGHAYTRRHSPLPSVLVMVLFLFIQLGACLVTLPVHMRWPWPDDAGVWSQQGRRGAFPCRLHYRMGRAKGYARRPPDQTLITSAVRKIR